jgi:3-oxoacyl-[acyl-carrier-protein] synthase II
MHERFVITGYGTFNSIGKNVKETFLASLEIKSKTHLIKSWDPSADPAFTVFRANCCDTSDILTEREYRHLPSLTKAAMVATDEAVRQSNFKSNRVATIISSIAGGNDSREKLETDWHRGRTKSNPFNALGVSYDYTSTVISTHYKWNGPSTVMVSACASGLYSIDYGIKCIKAGDCDYAVVGGTDMMSDKYDMFFFQVLQALSKRNEEYISQPFSDQRDGLVMGEGAGVFVIETMANAVARGATILAEIKGLGFYTECEHPTSPSDAGTGALESSRIALERSGLDKVDFISAHATSTVLGDIVEYEAMNKMFPDAYITGSKGHLGHTMSASAIIESIISIEGMNNNIIPPTANFTQCSFEKELKIVKEKTALNIDSFMKNSYGFGGKCSSIVYQKVK